MTGQVIYQPLIWQLSVICNCPQHQTPLQLYCPYKDCRQTLPPLAPHFLPGYCTHCERWLGKPLVLEDCQPISRDEQGWQVQVEQAAGDLLAAAPNLTSIPCQELISAVISAHVYGTMGGNFSEFARRVQFHRRTVWEWAQGSQLPQLDALLQICSYFGITPVHLLIGNIREVAHAHQNSVGNKSSTGHSCKQLRRFETEKLQDALEQALRSEGYPPPSMREVAQSLNYDQSHLRKYFPDLCHAISTKYLTYQRGQRLRRLQSMSDQVQQAVQTLHEHKCSLSERQVGKMIGKRGMFKEDAARVALKDSFTSRSEN
jgi:transcriptional regulator with XRE-family HTH domain